MTDIGVKIQEALLNQTIHQITTKADSVTLHTKDGHTVEFSIGYGETHPDTRTTPTYLSAIVGIVTEFEGKATI